jgi:O-antigen/teichoic acid export membrane protein
MAIQSIAKIPVIFFLSAIGSLGIIASYGLAYLIAVVVAIFILIPRVTTNYLPLPVLDLQLLKRISYYSIGNYIAWIFETIPNFILPIIVLNRLNSEMTAYFYMAWMIAGVVFIVPKAVATSLFAEGSNNESVLEQNVSRSLKITAGLVIPALVITILFSDKILLVFGEDYSIYGEKLLIVLVFSALPMIFNNIYISKKRVQKDIKAVIHINAIITIGTLVIGFLAISKLGIIAIGIGWFTSQIISLVYIHFQTKIEQIKIL